MTSHYITLHYISSGLRGAPLDFDRSPPTGKTYCVFNSFMVCCCVVVLYSGIRGALLDFDRSPPTGKTYCVFNIP